MIIKPMTMELKNGKSAIIRNAEPKDAEDLIKCLKTTATETPYLMRNPQEINLTLEEEVEFINGRKEAKGSLLLIGEIDGNHVGNASCMPLGGFERYAHRCSVAIALYQKYWGLGLGKIMLGTVLEKAKEMGYEQAELEVVTTNTNAIALYEKLGFQSYGTQKHSMKYPDGSYADEYLMMKEL